MPDVPATVMHAFLQACHEAADAGLMQCSSGNISFRLDEHRLIASASRSWMSKISEEQVSLCRIDDGSLLAGPTPSVEVGFHAGILKTRPDVNAIIHFQTPCATALACRTPDPDYFVLPEIPFYIGHVARVPFLPPGSPELAEAVINAAQTHDMIVLTSHGLVTMADTPDNAIQNARFFELACEIITCNPIPPIPLPPGEIERLLACREEKRSINKNISYAKS